MTTPDVAQTPSSVASDKVFDTRSVASSFGPSSPRSVRSVNLRSYHCSGRGIITPTARTRSTLFGGSSGSNHPPSPSRRPQTSGACARPGQRVVATVDDRDVERALNDFRMRSGQHKTHLDSMTPEELFQANLNQKMISVLPNQRKEFVKSMRQRGTEAMLALPGLYGSVTSVRDMCREIRMSCRAVEAANNGDPEEESTKQRKVKKKLTHKLAVQNVANMNIRELEKTMSLHSYTSSNDGHHGFTLSISKSMARVGEFVETSSSMKKMHESAASLQMSMEDVLLIRNVFDTYDVSDTGVLGEEFEKVVYDVMQIQLRDKIISHTRVHELCEQYKAGVYDPEKEFSIAFEDFLIWYANVLRKNSLATETERIQKLAMECNMEKSLVEHLKRCFDTHHNDMGCINATQFKEVLHRSLRVPPNMHLNEVRLTQFFNSCDTDRSGSVAFEEFLGWWQRYFCKDAIVQHEDDSTSIFQPGKARLPFESFYRRIRSPGKFALDPPAYYRGCLVSELVHNNFNSETTHASPPHSRSASKDKAENRPSLTRPRLPTPIFQSDRPTFQSEQFQSEHCEAERQTVKSLQDSISARPRDPRLFCPDELEALTAQQNDESDVDEAPEGQSVASDLKAKYGNLIRKKVAQLSPDTTPRQRLQQAARRLSSSMSLAYRRSLASTGASNTASSTASVGHDSPHRLHSSHPTPSTPSRGEVGGTRGNESQ